MKIAEFELESGGKVLVQAAEPASGVRTRSGGDHHLIEKAKLTIEHSLQGVLPLVQSVRAKLAASLHSPAEMSFEFGIILTAEAGAVIAKSSLEAHFQVSVTWKT